jgi:hypothetical protein
MGMLGEGNIYGIIDIDNASSTLAISTMSKATMLEVAKKLQNLKEPLPLEKLHTVGIWLEKNIIKHDSELLESVFLKVGNDDEENLGDK